MVENVSQGVNETTNNIQLSLSNSNVAKSAVSVASGLLSAASAVYSPATTQQGTQQADSGGLGSPHIPRVVQFNSGARSKQAKRGLEQVDRTTDDLESPAVLKLSIARLEKLASELLDDALLKDEEIKRLIYEADARAEAFAKLTAHVEQLTRSLDELANAVNSRQVQTILAQPICSTNIHRTTIGSRIAPNSLWNNVHTQRSQLCRKLNWV